MAAAQIVHERLSLVWCLHFCALISAQMFPPCPPKASPLVAPTCSFGAEKLSAPRNMLAVPVLLDHFPEDADHRDKTERVDHGPQIGDTEQVHDGVRKPQPEERRRQECRRRIGLAGDMS